jgi:drug/metabolite transporter (DMT)-like permease
VQTLVLTLWLLNVVLDTGGQLAFKRAAVAHGPEADTAWARWMSRVRDPWMWCAVVCFAAEFVLWLAFLSVVPLSRGVLLGSINIVVILIAGRLFFRELLSAWRMAGILLIATGVGIVGLS